MKVGTITPRQFMEEFGSAVDSLRRSGDGKDESTLVAKAIAKRVGLEECHIRDGKDSGGPLIALSLDYSSELGGMVPVFSAFPEKGRKIESIMSPVPGESLEAIYSKGGRSRSPRKILEDALISAEDSAGAWISESRIKDVCLVFRSSGAGILMVYSRDLPGRFRGKSRPSTSPFATIWAWRPASGPEERRLSTLDAFLSKK